MGDPQGDPLLEYRSLDQLLLHPLQASASWPAWLLLVGATAALTAIAWALAPRAPSARASLALPPAVAFVLGAAVVSWLLSPWPPFATLERCVATGAQALGLLVTVAVPCGALAAVLFQRLWRMPLAEPRPPLLMAGALVLVTTLLALVTLDGWLRLGAHCG